MVSIGETIHWGIQTNPVRFPAIQLWLREAAEELRDQVENILPCRRGSTSGDDLWGELVFTIASEGIVIVTVTSETSQQEGYE